MSDKRTKNNMKTITIKLSDKAEKYFNEVKYSLDDADGYVFCGKCGKMKEI